MSNQNNINNEITVISAFYKLDLDKKSKESYKSKRTVQTYLDFFSFNAGLKNKFVIYTDNDDVINEIYALRRAHGLESQTLAIKKSLESFSPKDYERIKKCFKDYDQKRSIHPPHTSPKYNYLMYCKSFFVLDAIKNPLSKNFISENLLWLDFGYNLGGSYFLNSKEFNFKLTPQIQITYDIELAKTHNIDIKKINILDNTKLNMFTLGNTDKRTLAHILIQGTSSFITGGCMYGNINAWFHFNKYIKQALKTFESFNIMDDDQQLYTWCVRNYPQYFNLLAVDGWFSALFYFIPKHKRQNIKVRSTSIFGGKENKATSIPEIPQKPVGAGLRIKNQLSYKLGLAMIENSRNFKGYLRMPFVLSYIKDKHKEEKEKYEQAIKQNSDLKLPKLEDYKDYEEALKLKEHLSYKLGQTLIKASNNNAWGGGGCLNSFYLKYIRLKKNLRKTNQNLIFKI